MPLDYFFEIGSLETSLGRFISSVCEFLEVVQLDIVKISRNAEFPLNQIGLPFPPSSFLSVQPTQCLFSG